MDSAGNSATECQQKVTIADAEDPVVTCPADKTVSVPSGQTEATVDPGMASATDNCPGVTVSGVRSDGEGLSDRYPVGVTNITWTATDEAGNTADSTQKVTVVETKARIHGRVTCLDCNCSIRNARVELTQGGQIVMTTLSGEVGTHQFVDVPNSLVTKTYSIFARHPDHRLGVSNREHFQFSQSTGDVQVNVGMNALPLSSIYAPPPQGRCSSRQGWGSPARRRGSTASRSSSPG